MFLKFTRNADLKNDIRKVLRRPEKCGRICDTNPPTHPRRTEMYKGMMTALLALSMSAFSTNAFADNHEGDEEAEEVAAPDPGTQVSVRLLTHFHKKISDSGWGVGGWIIMPDITKMGTIPLFLVGPRYQAKGAWVEVMAGGLVTPDADPANAGFTKTKTVQSTRLQMTPKYFDSPINVFGNLQFIDIGGSHPVTEQSTMVTYTFLMADYVLGDGAALVGIETENYFGKIGSEMDGDELATFNDIAVGPQVVLPFHDLNVIMSYQLHFDENTENQVWVRAMYNFGPKPAKK